MKQHRLKLQGQKYRLPYGSRILSAHTQYRMCGGQSHNTEENVKEETENNINHVIKTLVLQLGTDKVDLLIERMASQSKFSHQG